MAGPIENLWNQILSASNNFSGSPNRSTSPYYRYGQKWFDTNEENPPQIRIRPTSGIINRKEKIASSGVSGSLGTLQQSIEIKIWGQDEQEVFQELGYLIKGIDYVRGTKNNQSISQPSIIETSTDWANTSARNSFGEMMLLNYEVKINIDDPTLATNFALVTTASVALSGSSYENSSSYQGTRSYLFLSNSYLV
jgi:hypothetical protein